MGMATSPCIRRRSVNVIADCWKLIMAVDDANRHMDNLLARITKAIWELQHPHKAKARHAVRCRHSWCDWSGAAGDAAKY
jgi:hypothetical protein